ncbi:MAG: four helix bundle protein [Bacteroidota bacterium]
MTENSITKHVFDLEERTLKFAMRVRLFIKKFPNTLANVEDCKQLIRASGSIGANYIEANEALSKKEFQYRIKVCLKESKESVYFLRLISELCPEPLIPEVVSLRKEAIELKKIFASILLKSR